MVETGAGREALGHLETALAERPKKNGHALSSALRGLAGFRQELIAARDAGTADAGRAEWLDHVNAVISCVMAVQFPLEEVPWDELHKAHDWLAEAIEGVAVQHAA